MKNTPPLGEFGVSLLEAIEDRENGTCFLKERTFENFKVTQSVLQVYSLAANVK